MPNPTALSVARHSADRPKTVRATHDAILRTAGDSVNCGREECDV
jgi:hypothetical protein